MRAQDDLKRKLGARCTRLITLSSIQHTIDNHSELSFGHIQTDLRRDSCNLHSCFCRTDSVLLTFTGREVSAGLLSIVHQLDVCCHYSFLGQVFGPWCQLGQVVDLGADVLTQFLGSKPPQGVAACRLSHGVHCCLRRCKTS